MPQFILTCPHNTAQIAKKELHILGYNATITSSTSLSFSGDFDAIARVNINSRIGNKLYLQLEKTAIKTFDDLFATVENIERHTYIAPGQPITITAKSKKSQITSTPTIQSIVKKAIIKQLLRSTEGVWEENNEQHDMAIHVVIDSDTAYILINTTGEGLHNRGYRQHTGDAPLKENLAAALVLSSGRRFSQTFIDPFCGAGTIPIEAALIAKNIAPGLIRAKKGGFAFQQYIWYNTNYKEHITTAMQSAEINIMTEKEHEIIGYDIDDTMIAIAKDNAKNAGVEKYITFKQRDFLSERDLHMTQGAIVTNPPYGERMKSEELLAIYEKIISLYEKNTTINGGFITSIADTESLIQPHFWKQTLYYNGPLECRFFKIARL